MTPSHITRKKIKPWHPLMALFSSWKYVSVSCLYFLPGYIWGFPGFIFFSLIYNQEENKAMTHSHITRKKLKPWHPLTYNQEENKAMTHSHITRGVMALISSWLYVSVSWLYFLPGYIWGCPGFIFFLVIYEGVMALFSSWLYVRVSWLYFLPG
jgi:hypothetical protein